MSPKLNLQQYKYISCVCYIYTTTGRDVFVLQKHKIFKYFKSIVNMVRFR
jgi:hypothetical protein